MAARDRRQRRRRKNQGIDRRSADHRPDGRFVAQFIVATIIVVSLTLAAASREIDRSGHAHFPVMLVALELAMIAGALWLAVAWWRSK